MNNQITEDLARRCAEIINWQDTGILQGDALRAFANKQPKLSSGGGLMLAESKTAREAMEFVVAASQSAHSGDVPSRFEKARSELLGADDVASETADLVDRFAVALLRKLADAENKYGYGLGWLENGWMDECRTKLCAHVTKGDPRDVAAYCAFLWHHGESTAAAPQAAPQEISGYCASAGCVHKAFGCPAWAQGSNPFAAPKEEAQCPYIVNDDDGTSYCRLAEKPQEAQWRPIESAPKNVSILLFCPESGDWLDDSLTKQADTYYVLKSNDCRCPFEIATHWMPLPSPPQELAQAEGEKTK